MSTSLAGQLHAQERISDKDVWRQDDSRSSPSGGELAEKTPHPRTWKYHFPDGAIGIRLRTDPPGWLKPTFERLGRLLEMPANWDSYGAVPIDPYRVLAALNLLVLLMRDDTPAPAVVPTSRGGTQLEWHTRGIDLEIEALSGHRLVVFFEDSSSGEEWEGQVSMFDLGRVADYISRLSWSARAEGP